MKTVRYRGFRYTLKIVNERRKMRPGQGVGEQTQETQGDNHQFCPWGVSQEGSHNWIL